MRRATALAVPISRLSWSSSIHLNAIIHSWNLVYAAATNCKKTLKPLF